MIRFLMRAGFLLVVGMPAVAQEITVEELPAILPEELREINLQKENEELLTKLPGETEIIEEDQGPPTSIRYGIAELRGLDKVTGKAQTFQVPVGGEARYGRLRVRAMACDRAATNDVSDSAAFLQIVDPARAENSGTVFSGWMFAYAPVLSAMDHSRYDVWVLSCKIL